MTAQIIKWSGLTKLDIPVERVLNGALDRELQSAVVVGFTQEGDLHFASSVASGAEAIFLLQRAIHNLNRMMDDLMEGRG